VKTRKEREISSKDTIHVTNVLHGCWCRLERNKQPEALRFLLLSCINSILLWQDISLAIKNFYSITFAYSCMLLGEYAGSYVAE
jgi:hypothetical protein